MIDLTRYFGGVFVLNLDIHPERFDAFIRRATQNGITGFSRYRAIEGDKCPHPSWWRAGNGAWGCLMSHLRLAQDAIQDGLKSYLVFEDDAVFSPDFAEAVPRIMGNLEGVKWDQLYLGGQHLYVEASPPWPFRKEIVRCANVNRTHAFAVNARFMVKFVQHIMHFPDYAASHEIWKDDEGNEHEKHSHIDHQLGLLHERREDLILAAHPWVCGQAAGKSHISGSQTEEQWWQDEGWGK